MSPKPAERLSLSLITPNYNGDAFLRETFQSIASQKLSGLEYVFVDGASTDQSMSIAQEYSNLITRTISEPDRGHADALNKGFAASSGEIMGWINSDDVLLPGCLETVRQVFETFPEVEWITGRASSMNERGELIDARPARPWSRRRFLCGDHLWIQQESTFWRRSLWDRAGASLDTAFDVANDFELWARFFRHADLYTVDRMLGCFRVRSGQRSTIHRARYFQEVDQILRRELEQLDADKRVAMPRLLPSHPVTLSHSSLISNDGVLGLDDPPMLTSTVLRKGKLEEDVVREAAFDSDSGSDGMEPPTSGWLETLARNWRFVCLLGAAGGLLLLSGLLFPDHQMTILLGSLAGFSLFFTGALAIKVRRIILRLNRDLERCLSGRARSELRNQLLEVHIDTLHKRLDNRYNKNPAPHQSDKNSC